MTTSQEIADYVSGLTDALNRMDKEGIERMVETLVRAYESDSTVYICGNGGSGATASHIVCDFNKGISLHADRKLPITYQVRRGGRIARGSMLLDISRSFTIFSATEQWEQPQSPEQPAQLPRWRSR